MKRRVDLFVHTETSSASGVTFYSAHARFEISQSQTFGCETTGIELEAVNQEAGKDDNDGQRLAACQLVRLGEALHPDFRSALRATIGICESADWTPVDIDNDHSTDVGACKFFFDDGAPEPEEDD
jgi:hypothetical protein